MAKTRCESCGESVAITAAVTECPECGPKLRPAKKKRRKSKKKQKDESSAEPDFDPMGVLMAGEAAAETVADKPTADVLASPPPPKKSVASPVVAPPASDESTASAAQQAFENTNRPRMPVARSPKQPAFDLGEIVEQLKSNRAIVGAAVACLALAGFFTLRGCDDDRVPTYPVTGRVVFEDGTPVRLGVVEVESVEDATTSTGTIRQDGTFVLGTYTSNDGAPAGTHPAIVVQMLISDGTIKHSVDHGKPVDPRYGDYNRSGLEVTVEAIEKNEIEIRLKLTK